MIINIETCDPSTGYSLCLYPRESRRKRSSWIMWISPDGSADLWASRDESGTIQGEPIHLGPNVTRTQEASVINSSIFEDDDDTEYELSEALKKISPERLNELLNEELGPR